MKADQCNRLIYIIYFYGLDGRWQRSIVGNKRRLALVEGIQILRLGYNRLLTEMEPKHE